MSLTLSINESSRLSLNETLDLMMLTPARRKRVLKKTGQAVRKKSRQNLRAQKTVTGSPMANRGSGKGRMFKRIGKTMTTVTSNKDVTVTWKNPVTAKIAYRHQHGVSESFTGAKMTRIYGQPDYNQPATRKQAKALIASGYRLYAGKKKGRTQTKRPSQRWIMDNMTIGHAGLMIRNLRGEITKKSWSVKTPARPFLGVTDDEGTRILRKELVAEWERQS